MIKSDNILHDSFNVKKNVYKGGKGDEHIYYLLGDGLKDKIESDNLVYDDPYTLDCLTKESDFSYQRNHFL